MDRIQVRLVRDCGGSTPPEAPYKGHTMKKYVILKKYHKPYELSATRKQHYALYFHTKTKLENNEAYWSLDTSRRKQEKYAVTKEQLPALLQQAQNQIRLSRKVIKKSASDGKVFVLKINSPKLLSILGS